MRASRCIVSAALVLLLNACAGCSGGASGVAYTVDKSGRKAPLHEIYASGFNQSGLLSAGELGMGDPLVEWLWTITARSGPPREPFAIIIQAANICAARAAAEERAKARDARPPSEIRGRAWVFAFLTPLNAAGTIRIDEVRMEPHRLRVRYHVPPEPSGMLTNEPVFPALWIPLDGSSRGNFAIEVVDATNGGSFKTWVNLAR